MSHAVGPRVLAAASVGVKARSGDAQVGRPIALLGDNGVHVMAGSGELCADMLAGALVEREPHATSTKEPPSRRAAPARAARMSSAVSCG